MSIFLRSRGKGFQRNGGDVGIKTSDAKGPSFGSSVTLSKYAIFAFLAVMVTTIPVYIEWKKTSTWVHPHSMLARPFERPSEEDFPRLRERWKKTRTTIEITPGQLVTLGVSKPLNPDVGHVRLPDLFYNSTLFGLSAMNPLGVKQTDEYNRRANRELEIAVHHFRYKPDRILKCTFVYPGDDTIERGFVLVYHHFPVVTETEHAIAFQAKRFGQGHWMKWSPVRWGAALNNMYMSVMQEVLPSASNMHGIHSKAAVYKL